MASKKASILLVDDHPLWRQTISTVLDRHKDLTVTAEAGTGGEAVTLLQEHAGVNLVLLDLDLPDTDGIAVTTAMLEQRPDLRILMLSASDDRAKVIAAVRAGVCGYIVKTSGAGDIADAIVRIHRGEMVFPPSLAEHVLGALRGASLRSDDPVSTLTDSERDVLSLMAEGHSNKAIAGALHLSEKTIEARIGSIFTKLGLDRDAGLNRRVRAVLTYLEAGDDTVA